MRHKLHTVVGDWSSIFNAVSQKYSLHFIRVSKSIFKEALGASADFWFSDHGLVVIQKIDGNGVSCFDRCEIRIGPPFIWRILPLSAGQNPAVFPVDRTFVFIGVWVIGGCLAERGVARRVLEIAFRFVGSDVVGCRAYFPDGAES